jgi:hypothetical protein
MSASEARLIFGSVIATSFLRGYQPDYAAAFGMHDDEALVVHHAQPDEPLLSIILSIVDPCQNIALEYERGINDIDAALIEHLETLRSSHSNSITA